MHEAAGTDPIGALLVFLYLLEYELRRLAKFLLRKAEHAPLFLEASTNINIHRQTTLQPRVHCTPSTPETGNQLAKREFVKERANYHSDEPAAQQ